MSGQTNRRQFLQAGAAAGVGFWVAGGVQGQDKKSEMLNIACIGVGGKGSSDTDQAGKVGNVVALCDIDDHTLDNKAKKFPKAKKFNDFRKMLEEMEKQIDAVVVSTPDHTHAPASMMAMKMRKHVYCQKPLTHTVFEARRMREAAREYKVCTQMGNQGTASAGLRSSVEIIQSGGLGEIKEVHVWTNRPVWPQSPKITSRPRPSEPPKHVHWDLWLGAAPERPYSNERQYNGKGPYHDFNWRGWWDFGTGALGDMACHTANMAFMALKLAHPTTIAGESEKLNDETYPAWAKVVYEFATPFSPAPIRLTWYEGRKDGKLVQPPLELLQGEKISSSGCLVVGTRGTLYSPDDYGGSRKLLGKEMKDYTPPKPTLPRTSGDIDTAMKREWANAIKADNYKLALSNFDYAGMLTETVLLGNVAIRAGKKLEWDGPNLKFTNLPEADKFLRTEYRTGYKL